MPVHGRRKQMTSSRRPASWLAIFGFCLLALELGQHGVDAARLAATKAAREEAAAKRDKAKTPEEIQQEKERLEKLKGDIESLLKESKEYRQAQCEPARHKSH